ncbi:tetratricopeptide repeat-containing sensor histidine kinase [Constantimarinum furrinae]|uniref:histidine kinase n=1 Tax=Constantimarinum furrinae TaxID=2562285 RepID=A0A7G8PRQ1_9FLAO|nr:tetratricopeptide repeat-containing sensor histidine kinase [Constantimarinum furrinae]QNJ97017.1 ATP-binding protein [Constantimarinum furrinae]
MKTILFLFLFCISGLLTFGQEESDSLSYYYYSIVRPNEKSNTPAAIRFFRKRKYNSLKNNDTLNAIYASRMIAQGVYFEGHVYESEQEAVTGLQLIGDKEGEIYDEHRLGFFTQLGMVYRNIRDFKQAITIYDQALALKPNPDAHVILLNNKANAYKSLEEFNKAEEILLTGLEIVEKMQDTIKQALLLDNLGEVQHRLKDPKALNTLHKALRLRLNFKNLKHRFTSYMSLADFYLATNSDSSNYYIQKALSTAKSLKNSAYKHEAFNLLLKDHVDPDVREFMALTDSINTAAQLEDNKYAYRKWNVAEAKKRQELAEIGRESEKGKRILYQWIGLLVVVIAILLFFLFRIKHKRDRIRQVYETETRISKKVHDEVANDIYHLMNNLQQQKDVDARTVDSLDSLYNKTRDISKEISSISLDKEFDLELTDMLESFQNDEVNIITRNLSSITWSDFSKEKKLTIYRVLQELLTNMKKHSNASLVALQFEQKGKKCRIEYTDNGKGTVLEKGNGIRNTENRMDSINGSISFESSPGKGFKAIIAI